MKRGSQKRAKAKAPLGQLDLFAERAGSEHPAAPGLVPTTLAAAPYDHGAKRVGKRRKESAALIAAGREKAALKKAPAPQAAASGGEAPVEIKLLSTRQAASRLGLGFSTLEKMRARGDGPRFLKLTNSAIRYHPGDLEDWMNTRARPGRPEPS